MSKHRNSPSSADPRRRLPSVSVLLDTPPIQALLACQPRALVVDAVRRAVEQRRAASADKNANSTPLDVAKDAVALFHESEHERLRPVINGTGIILHTGLGRAVLPKAASQALAQLDGCCNLQIDLDTGLRGRRNYMTEKLLCRLTGAEAAMVVNNNAAATMLILASLCAGKEVIVSRGQLIEIGGSYRLPDCVLQSGAALVEVGTTNKTHLRDYKSALSENTGAVLRVNPSNYRVVGFSKSVPIEDLVTLKETQPVLVIDDLGCGALINLEEYGLPHEPTVQESVAAGADLVCFSGDKLIGGPQSGIIVGSKVLIDVIRRHPLTRMLRIGKLTDMALEHTLRMFLEPETLRHTHPTLRMLAESAEQVKARAESLAGALSALGKAVASTVEAVDSATGGGSLPATAIPSFALAVTVGNMGAAALARRLRQNEPPIITKIRDERVLIDMRTVLDGEEALIEEALRRIATEK